MKLISWNVNGLRACVGKNFMEDFKKLDADILRHLPLLCSGRSYREQQKIKILWRILL